MSRFILAIPAAAAAASLSVYKVSGTTPSSGTPSPLPPTSGLDRSLETRTRSSSPSPANKNYMKKGTSSRRTSMPSRFQIEDPDAVRNSLRPNTPPVGDSALRSGLGVEVSTW